MIGASGFNIITRAPKEPNISRLEEYRREEDAEREKHLNQVFHVPEEEVRAADEERQPGPSGRTRNRASAGTHKAANP